MIENRNLFSYIVSVGKEKRAVLIKVAEIFSKEPTKEMSLGLNPCVRLCTLGSP